MLILASGSPRRRELLTQIGVAYMVNPSSYHEESPKKKDPQKYVQDQALGKARDVAQKFPGQWVLGADTIVALDGVMMGKPKNGTAAMEMLRELSGKKHSVYTGIALINDKKEYTKVVETKVWFRHLTDKEIKSYIASGEPLDKAGAYGIQAGLRPSSIRSTVPIPTSSACPYPRSASCSTRPRFTYEYPGEGTRRL